MARSFFALAVVLSVASASLAGDLVTPPMGVGAATTAVCRLANITSATIPAQIEMIESAGDVLVNSGPITVGPGRTRDIVFVGPQVPVYCRFVKASKSKVRAALSTFVTADTADGSDHVVVPAQ
jgi:hypothetical protein